MRYTRVSQDDTCTGILLPYPPNAIGLETAFIFLYIIIEWIRLRLRKWFVSAPSPLHCP